MRDTIIKHKSKIAYLVVGGWNTLFGYGVFALLYYLFSYKLHSIVILTVSYILSITNAYIGYKVFVFRTKGNFLREYLRFYTVYGGFYIANIVMLPFFMNIFMLNAYASQACVVTLTVLSSYLLHKKYTFKA